MEQHATLAEVRSNLRALTLVELLRPSELSISPTERMRSTSHVRVAQARVLRVSDELDRPEIACALGWSQLAGSLLGWPAAAQVAELLLRRCNSAGESDADPLVALGMLHLLTGDRQGARSQLETAYQSDPDADALLLLSLALALEQRPQDASDAFARLPASVDAFEQSLREIVRLALRSPGSFASPSSLQIEARRPTGVSTALSFPDVLYRNERHGFTARFPLTWTLHDEETAFPLSACNPLAELTLDMPLTLSSLPTADFGRVRVLAYSVAPGTSSEALFDMPLPQYPLPTEARRLDAILEDSVHLHFRDGELSDDREGELVLLVHAQMAFLFHWMSSVERYAGDRAAFERFLRAFRFHDPGELVLDPCKQRLRS